MKRCNRDRRKVTESKTIETRGGEQQAIGESYHLAYKNEGRRASAILYGVVLRTASTDLVYRPKGIESGTVV